MTKHLQLRETKSNFSNLSRHFQEHYDNVTFPKSSSSKSPSDCCISSEYEDSLVQKYYNQTGRPYDDSIASAKTPSSLKQSTPVVKQMKPSWVPGPNQVNHEKHMEKYW